MRIRADEQRSADMIGSTIQADRLSDRQDMPFIKGGVERRAPVTGGPKLYLLFPDLAIGDQGVIRGDKLRNIGQQRRHGGLARIRTDRHMMAGFFAPRMYRLPG